MCILSKIHIVISCMQRKSQNKPFDVTPSKRCLCVIVLKTYIMRCWDNCPKELLFKETFIQGLFVQGTFFQGDFCPRRFLSKETFVRADFCPKLSKDILCPRILLSKETLVRALLYCVSHISACASIL